MAPVRDLGVVGQHRRRLAEEPAYREAALTPPSITTKTGISAKYLERTAPTALSGSGTATAEIDLDTATGPELIEFAEANDIEVKKSAKVDEIREQIRAAR